MNTLTQVSKNTTVISCNKEKRIDVVTNISNNLFKSLICFNKETTDLESLGDKRSFMINLFEAQGIDLASIETGKPRVSEDLRIARVYILPKQGNVTIPIEVPAIRDELNAFRLSEYNEPTDNILSVNFKPKRIFKESFNKRQPGGSRYKRIVLEKFDPKFDETAVMVSGEVLKRVGETFRYLDMDLDLLIHINLITGNMQVIVNTMPAFSSINKGLDNDDLDGRESFKELDFEVVGVEVYGSVVYPDKPL